MAKNNGNALDLAALVSGDGALTYSESAALASQYRTAETAENLAAMRKGRVAYVVVTRGAVDQDGNVVALADLARQWGVSKSALTYGHSAYAIVVRLGLVGESDATQRQAFVAANRVRKMGKDDATVGAVDAVLSDLAALPVKDRASALDAATSKDGEMSKAVKAVKSSADAGTREANNTPTTTGEESATGKASVLSALGAIVQAAQGGVALTTGEADQVARYLGALTVHLGVSLDAVTDYAATESATLALV